MCTKLEERIINCQLSIATKKDFSEEVRALVDVRKFVSDSFILTDITEVRIGAIVEDIIDRLVDCRGLDDDIAHEAKSLLFVEQSSLSMLLSNTMQGLYKSRRDGRLAYDQSWVVATGTLTSLYKRQVAIARFPQPVNFGPQAQEVRFLIIVLAPNKDKITKSAWETGRTFATMFVDLNFRRRLLRAKSQDEFKMELLRRAETLALESETGFQFDCSAYHQHRESSGAAADQLAAISISTKFGSALSDLNSGAGGETYNWPYRLDTCAYHSSCRKLQQQQQQELQQQSQATSKINNNNNKQLSNISSLFGSLGSGLVSDFKRRSKYYLSDFTDGFIGERSLYKTFSTTVFLYFCVILPCVAFGVVDTNNTDGQIDPKKTMIGQALGGLFFAVFSGQPLVVVMTTAPLCIYVKVIYLIAQDLEVEFGTFYACVGLWMCFFLIIMSISNSSNLMKYCTRSTEDIFALFTAFAFGSDGIKEAIRSFKKYYWDPDCTFHIPQPLPSHQLSSSSHIISARSVPSDFSTTNTTNDLSTLANHTITNLTTTMAAAIEFAVPSDHINHSIADGSSASSHIDFGSHLGCQRETCILFLFLMCGTLWLANSFSSFDKTPYLSYRKREIIKDYALAISVLIFSFLGSYIFADIRLDVFEFSDFAGLHFAPLAQLSYKTIGVGCGLGFMLAVLFYIDQNICGAMVNNAPYKLRKGDYFHLDLIILAILNGLLSLTGLPWMHGKLPHSHLHSKALADYEERVDEGHVHQTIVNIRETRLTGIFVSILIGLSLLAVPYPLSYIPLPVLSGVFLYTALAEFKSNSMVERVCLLFTEQAAYPPNHYIRRCPQRKIHFFTVAQLIQLAVVSFVGFYPNPYVNMAFPLVVATFVPIRNKLLPYLIDTKYLNHLDSASTE